MSQVELLRQILGEGTLTEEAAASLLAQASGVIETAVSIYFSAPASQQASLPSTPLQQLRAVLGPEPSDALLRRLLKLSKNDVEQAVIRYLPAEGPLGLPHADAAGPSRQAQQEGSPESDSEEEEAGPSMRMGTRGSRGSAPGPAPGPGPVMRTGAMMHVSGSSRTMRPYPRISTGPAPGPYPRMSTQGVWGRRVLCL